MKDGELLAVEYFCIRKDAQVRLQAILRYDASKEQIVMLYSYYWKNSKNNVYNKTCLLDTCDKKGGYNDKKINEL